MSVAILANNVSKAYQLGEFSTGTLSRDIERAWYRIRGKDDPFLKIGEANDRTVRGGSDVVWSLKDIDFSIEQGDAVGVIGRNGAGKSTLLKLLSRVTTPTTGSIKVKGRIASLLEVGTGFHPELTGRENIFLNGAILGMRKMEIKKRFDEIVDFAGVERYLDTPVKRYSSGMYVRLAFAVAAHLDSEILIVDEVLAVGDAEFQKKCLGKMGDVSKGQGRTVLFVSHNIASIRALCKSGIMLKNGQLHYSGEIEECIEAYLGDQDGDLNKDIAAITKRQGDGSMRFKSIHFIGADGREKDEFECGESISVRVHFTADEKFMNARASRIDMDINDMLSNRVAWMSSFVYSDKLDPDKFHVEFHIEKLLLNQGTYSVGLYADTNLGIADWVENVGRFSVNVGDFYGTGKYPPPRRLSTVTEFSMK